MRAKEFMNIAENARPDPQLAVALEITDKWFGGELIDDPESLRAALHYVGKVVGNRVLQGKTIYRFQPAKSVIKNARLPARKIPYSFTTSEDRALSVGSELHYDQGVVCEIVADDRVIFSYQDLLRHRSNPQIAEFLSGIRHYADQDEVIVDARTSLVVRVHPAILD
jgi:hypothetical protein